MSKAQSETLNSSVPKIELSAFMDAYYVYDFNQPGTRYRQNFLYNHNRHNEFNLNLGFIRVAAQDKHYRAGLALQAGTYVNDNYANEPGVLKNIFEANAGILLSSKNNLWFDIGVFGSHIGFESAISIDNWTLTRSLLAENSPYYLSGAKLTYTPNKNLTFSALACNGWQRIQPREGNSLPGFGTQLKLTPTENATLNWSTFIGTDDPDSIRRMRYFNNFFGQYMLNDKFGIIAGFDIGLQQKSKNSSSYDIWFSPVLIAQYTIHQKVKAAFRAEYYQDKTGIIISPLNENGFSTTGFSLNLDYSPTPNIVSRVEARWLNSQDPIFTTKSLPTNHNFIVAASIAVRFSETLNK